MTSEDPLARATALMASSGGVLTRKRALAAGLSPAEVKTLLRRGTWTTVRTGVYAEAVAADPGDSSARDVAAAAAARRGRHAGSHRSAALVLGLPLLGRPPAVPELVRAPRRRHDSAQARGLHVAALEDGDVTTCRGVLVTSPARTVCDVARTSSFREAVVVADAALHAGLSRELLEEQLRRCAGWPGARQARRVLAFADERTESPLESLDRIALVEAGLSPRTQVDVRGPRGEWLGRVDFLLEAERTVVEADGMAKYRLPGAQVPSWAEDVLVREKQRELGLRAVGLEVVRNDWTEVFHRPHELVQRVRQHVWLASRYPVVPGVTFSQPPVRRRPLAWPLGSSSRAAA